MPEISRNVQNAKSSSNLLFTSDFDTFSEAVTAAAGNLLIVNSVVVQAANLTVTGVHVHIQEGGSVSISSTFTLTWNCPITADSWVGAVLIGAGTHAGLFNLVLGINAGNALSTAPTFDGHNTFIGQYAGENVTVSRDNTFTGYRCGRAHISDAGAFGGNSAYGVDAFLNNTTGYQNTALGNNALLENISGNFNTAGGWGALMNNLLSNNTAFGIQALYLGQNNDDSSAFGMFALANCSVTATKNTALGFSAALNFGKDSLGYAGGDGNLFCGTQAGLAYQGGNRNTLVGTASASHGATTDMIGDDNSLLGYKSADNNLVLGNKNTIIGAYSDIPTIAAGTTTATTANKLVDSSQQFDEIAAVGMSIKNTTDTTYTTISAVDSASTLSLNDDIMVSGETYIIYDENSSVVIAAGGSTGNSETRYYCDSRGHASIVEPATIGRYVQAKSSETITAYTGAPSAVVVQTNVPSGAKILGAIVKLDVAGAANDTWDAAYSGGATQSITTTEAGTSGNTAKALFNVNAATDITSSEVDVTFTKAGGGNFTDTGTFRAVVFYETIDLFKN